MAEKKIRIGFLKEQCCSNRELAGASNYHVNCTLHVLKMKRHSPKSLHACLKSLLLVSRALGASAGTIEGSIPLYAKKRGWCQVQAELWSTDVCLVYPTQHTAHRLMYPTQHTAHPLMYPTQHTTHPLMYPTQHTAHPLVYPTQHTTHPLVYPTQHTTHRQ